MKIAVLLPKEKSTWQSCQTISKNLLSAYTALAKKKQLQIEFCPYYKKKMETDGESIFEGFKERGITRIVIIDHFPYPGKLFEIFERVFRRLDYYPEIYVHSYGCLMMWFHELDHKSPFFEKCKIHFITASEAQKMLLAQFLNRNIQISVMNFPLDTEIFSPKKSQAELKKELGLLETDILLIYTGRAHIQKNLPLLLQCVSGIVKKHPNIKFLFAGSYDDSPINFLDYRYAYGVSQALVKEAVREGNLENHFVELGNLSQSQLAKYLNAADIFCSLSMYNDEDYGYGPLEALASGCAALLTAWGGYKEFQSPYTAFVKVRREYVKKVDSLFVSPTEVQTKLEELLQRLPLNRDDVHQYIEDRYSILSIAKQILALHKRVKPEPILFNRASFLKLKKDRVYPLHRYVYLDIYKSYYR